MKIRAQFANPKCTLLKFCNLAKIQKFISQPQIYLPKILQTSFALQNPMRNLKILCKLILHAQNALRNLRGSANPFRNLANSNSHLNLYFKASKPCIHFANPSAPCETPHHLAMPKRPLVFSPVNVPRPTI